MESGAEKVKSKRNTARTPCHTGQGGAAGRRLAERDRIPTRRPGASAERESMSTDRRATTARRDARPARVSCRIGPGSAGSSTRRSERDCSQRWPQCTAYRPSSTRENGRRWSCCGTAWTMPRTSCDALSCVSIARSVAFGTSRSRCRAGRFSSVSTNSATVLLSVGGRPRSSSDPSRHGPPGWVILVAPWRRGTTSLVFPAEVNPIVE